MTEPVVRTVVVGEDEALIRLDLVEMLREEGYNVVGEAANGQEAVELVQRLHPDVVILDIKMPVMDGLAAAEILGQRRLAPVVLLTAFSQRDLVERARQSGALAYVVKPFQKKDLIPAIEIAVSRFAELSELDQQIDDLTMRLEARKDIERAKGLLMEKHQLGEPAAFRWIQRTAMDLRSPMHEVAKRIIAELS